MRVLFLVSTIGPAEASLLDNAQHQGHEVDVLNVQGGTWLRRSAPQRARSLPRWSTYWPLRTARNQIARSLRQIVVQGEYDAFFALSLPAAGFAARYLEEEFVPLLWRGDLDFSAARVQLTQDALDLTTAVDRIFLQDEYEFDKALTKGSRSAHLKHLPVPIPVDPRSLLNDASESGPQVLMLHPERVSEERRDAQATLLRSVVERHGGTLTTLSASALYRSRDLGRLRTLERAATPRLNGYTHVVLTGVSRDHGAVADLLLRSGQGHRLVVEETIGMGHWARAAGFGRTARGARLGTLLERMLQGDQRHSGGGSITEPVTDVLADYLQAMSRPVARDHEQLQVLEEDGPVDVFFSTSPMEDRTDGARPQRVRNMAEAMDGPGNAVRLYSIPAVFHRRAALITRLLASGRTAGLFYGENSTSPIPFQEIVPQVADLARLMRHHGGGSAWFVRDLHWLDEIDGYLDEPERRTQMQRDGLRELSEMGGAVDVLAAPCAAAGEGFNSLLERHGQPAREWYPLPPAVAPQNVTHTGDVDAVAPDAGRATLLYAGGVGSLYGLDEYLSAVQGLGEEVHLDFVVRAAEVDLLHVLLERHGLSDHPRLRILTESLEWYLPTTRRVIGAVLLGGEYARFSFPYKTVSLLERGCAVLCFEDMAIADFVRERQIGEVCARHPDAVREAIAGLMVGEPLGLESAQREETWSARVQALRCEVAERTSVRGVSHPTD